VTSLVTAAAIFVFSGTLNAQQAAVPADAKQDTSKRIESAATNPVNPKLNSDNLVPLFFDVENEVVNGALSVSYDLQSSEGKQLVIGDLQIDERSFRLQLVKNNLLIYFPHNLFQSGLLEMITKSGRVRWVYRIPKNSLSDFAEDKEKILRTLKKQTGINIDEVKFAVVKMKEGSPEFWNFNENFRFCMTEEGKFGRTRICTPRYEIKKENSELKFVLAPVGLQPARVIVNNETAQLKSSYSTKIGEGVQFYSELSNGMSVDFYVVAPFFRMIDLVQLDSGDYSAVIEGSRPIGLHTEINQEKISRFFRFFGWYDTIGDKRFFYQTVIPKGKPGMSVRSEDGGGVFYQKLSITDVPTEQDRVFIDKYTPKVTYVNNAKVYVKAPDGGNLFTEQNTVESLKDSDFNYRWRFKATEWAAMAKSTLNVENSQKKYKVYYEMYRGFPREIGLRLGQVLGNSNSVSVMEGAFNYWFEDLFGSSNLLFSRLRWGISLKSNESINDVEIKIPRSDLPSSTVSIFSKLKFQTADLKYRLTPGIWGRDETAGLILSAMAMNFYDASNTMFGGGMFWARSMPKGFDEVLNIFPWLRYPKWVDVEAIMYVGGTNKRAALNPDFSPPKNFGNFSLNFHGKVLWSKRFFGELGFGLRSINYNRIYDRRVDGVSPPEIIEGVQYSAWNFNYYSLYAIVGVGVNF
jgi:hypothetical protein